MYTNTYAGIGARNTPRNVLNLFAHLAHTLEQEDFILHSGGANGADKAFEAGIEDPLNAKIFLPWKNFNNNPSTLVVTDPAAFEMAAKFHPAWERCSGAARKFHARNCHQILGLSLDQPVEFVICWTPGGAVTGGTGQALRIAQHHEIPIYNFGTGSPELIEDEIYQFVAGE